MRKRYTLYITKVCNLDCSYCYELDKSSKNLSNSELEKNIDFIFSNASNKDDIEFEFIGGETFLNMDGIKFACNYIETKYSDFRITRYIATTNGTIYSKDIVDFINSKKVFEIGISIDGNKIMHDSCRHFKSTRKGTYSIVAENSKKFLKELKVEPIVTMTVHKLNIGSLFSGIKSLYNLGFNLINIGVNKTDIDDRFVKLFIEHHKQICEYILNQERPLKLFPMMEKQKSISIQTRLKGNDINNSSIVDVYEEATSLDDDRISADLKMYYSMIIQTNKVWTNMGENYERK